MRVQSYKSGSIKMMNSFSQLAAASGSTGGASPSHAADPTPRKSNGMFGVSASSKSKTGPAPAVGPVTLGSDGQAHKGGGQAVAPVRRCSLA